MLEIEVYGRIYGKSRPRMSTYRGFIRTYTNKITKAYEGKIKTSFLNKYPYFNPLDIDNALSIEVVALYPYKGSKKKKQEILDKYNLNDFVIPRLVTPDIDNILKVVLDALNGIAYVDDKAIYKCECEKRYSLDIEEETLKIFIKKEEKAIKI